MLCIFGWSSRGRATATASATATAPLWSLAALIHVPDGGRPVIALSSAAGSAAGRRGARLSSTTSGVGVVFVIKYSSRAVAIHNKQIRLSCAWVMGEAQVAATSALLRLRFEGGPRSQPTATSLGGYAS